MWHSRKWRSKPTRKSISRSLDALRPAIDRTFVSLSCKEIKALQQRGSAIALHEILSGPGTKIARVLIEGETSPDYARVVERILEIAPKHKTLFDGHQDKAVMVDHVGIFTRNLGVNGSKALRAGKISENEKLGMILLVMTKMVTATGPFETDIDMRHLLVRLARILMWAEKQGIDSINPDKIMNDFIDMDFVVAGSFFDETMTHDKTLAALDRVIRDAMDIELAEHAVRAAQAIGFKVV
ncbi:hypothetical protein AB9E06_33675 [Rhizobium leguminosarum]|uniref:hypothetical protein n=1 Tax=Rhizobium leguminosarum TaxID=384 RepID=UPI003F9D1FBE